MATFREAQMWRKVLRRLEWTLHMFEVSQRRRTPRSQRPRCGARTRTGGECQARAVWCHETDSPRNGRCRNHGGLSTGPRTEEGRNAIRQSNRRRAQRHKSKSARASTS